MRNLSSPYGRHTKGELSASEWYIVAPSGTANYADLGNLYPSDSEEGIPRLYTTPAAVFSQSNAIVSGRGDVIYLAPDYTTALTAGDLLNAETNGVEIVRLGARSKDGANVAYRATSTLPAGTTLDIFTVTGRVKLLDIVGTVTTAIQTQDCNLKISLNPDATGLSTVDICADLNITADVVATTYNITGTFATALVGASNGAAVAQAAPVNLEAGVLLLTTSATNTGSVKWMCRYIPLDPGARIIAA